MAQDSDFAGGGSAFRAFCGLNLGAFSQHFGTVISVSGGHGESRGMNGAKKASWHRIQI